MRSPNSGFTIFLGIMIIIALALDFFIVWLATRGRGWGSTFLWFFISLLVFGLIALIIFIIIWLFKKHKVDLLHVWRQKIIDSCQLTSMYDYQQLYLMGNDELSYKFLGHCIGICKITTEPANKIIEQKLVQVRPPRELYFIAFRKGNTILNKWFEPIKLFCGEKDDIMNNLNSDVLYLSDMALTPELFGFFFLSKHYRKTYVIDEPAVKAVHRLEVEEFLKEEKSIIDAVLDLAPQHVKEKEISNIQAVQPQQKT